MTKANKKEKVVLKNKPYTYYLLYFRKNKKNEMRALINTNIEVNAMTLTYAANLGLNICYRKVGAQNINDSLFKTFGMVLAGF